MSEKKRILIVDDDTEIRDLLEFDISSSGYFVDTASDGFEGLNKALNNKYDLILLDVMMPKMNGFEVCQNIRQAKINVPILMLTAKGTIGDKTSGFDSGADDYLVKPFDIQEVLLRIRVLLRRNQPQVENLGSTEILDVGEIEIYPDSLECVILNKRVKLTPEWQTFEIPAVCGLTDSNIRLNFSNMGFDSRHLVLEFLAENRNLNIQQMNLIHLQNKIYLFLELLPFDLLFQYLILLLRKPFL